MPFLVRPEGEGGGIGDSQIQSSRRHFTLLNILLLRVENTRVTQQSKKNKGSNGQEGISGGLS